MNMQQDCLSFLKEAREDSSIEIPYPVDTKIGNSFTCDEHIVQELKEGGLNLYFDLYPYIQKHKNEKKVLISNKARLSLQAENAELQEKNNALESKLKTLQVKFKTVRNTAMNMGSANLPLGIGKKIQQFRKSKIEEAVK